MAKIKKFPILGIRTIAGGKDPAKLVEDFILRLGHDPEESQREKDSDNGRWMIKLEGEEELEILVEGMKTPSETTIYMGVNVATVPLRNSQEVLVTAMQIADGLVGTKISLVGNFIILSASMAASGMNIDELDYHYRLITAQTTWFKEALAEELGIAEEE